MDLATVHSSFREAQEQKINQEPLKTRKFHFFFKLQNDTKFKNDIFNGSQIPSWRVDLLFGHLLQMKKLRHWDYELGHRAWEVPTPDFKVSAISSRIMEEMTRTSELKLRGEWTLLNSTGAYINAFCRNRKIMLGLKLWF